MKVLYIQGRANRSDPKSCAWMSNYPCEALIGESAGQVLSCEIRQTLQRADVVSTYGRRHFVSRQARQAESLRSQRVCTRTEAPCNGISQRGEVQEEAGCEVGGGNIVLMTIETTELDEREGPLIQQVKREGK